MIFSFCLLLPEAKKKKKNHKHNLRNCDKALLITMWEIPWDIRMACSCGT